MLGLFFCIFLSSFYHITVLERQMSSYLLYVVIWWFWMKLTPSHLEEHSVPIGTFWQLSDNYSQRAYMELKPPVENKPQLPLFRLNLSVCVRACVPYLRRCSCSPCVHTAPPILPEWTTGKYAAMREKGYWIRLFTAHISMLLQSFLSPVQSKHTEKWRPQKILQFHSKMMWHLE